MDVKKSGVLLVDVQESFLQLIENGATWTHRLETFLQIPKALRVPILITEQTPEKLGSTVDHIRQSVPEAPILPKNTFDCFECEDVLDWLDENGIDHLLILGVMSNVCILQTALRAVNQLELVQVAADGVRAESAEDDWWGLQRMDRAGAVVTTMNTAAYEWMRSPEHERFSDLLPVLKQLNPSDEE